MVDISIPHNWKCYTDREHPESSDLVNTVAWFEHQEGSEIIIWSGEITELSEEYKYYVELRDSDSVILTSEGFESENKDDAYYFAQEQMEMYPVQEVVKEEE